MEKISEFKVLEFKYDSKEEREDHIKLMESYGFECTGQVKKSDDSLFVGNRVYYWYGKFIKNF